jgi:DNA polymerase-3 subunit epsilon
MFLKEHNMRIMVMDTETGGLDPDKYSLLSVAAVVIDLSSGEELEKWEAFHRLPSRDAYRVTQKALEINGLNLDEVFENGIESKEICNKLVSIFQENNCVGVAGQNYMFDRRFLARRLFRVSEDELDRIFSRNGRINILDTMPISRMLTGVITTKNFSLGNLIKAFNVDMSDVKGKYHTALYDTISTARLLFKQRECLRKGFASELP